ncbi:MAG: thioesterase family protein [Pirellulaceae bacterium]|nr:thioesterase family protein [Pirellulaceae bacterium]
MPLEPIPAHLAGLPVVFSLPLQWGDQDAFQHVNNVVYFRWFESARIAYFDKAALAEPLDRHRLGPILAAISCNYRRQLRFPDTIHVTASVTRLGGKSLTMTHRLYCSSHPDLVAEGESTVVIFDYAGQRSVTIPDDVRGVIEALEGRKLG